MSFYITPRGVVLVDSDIISGFDDETRRHLISASRVGRRKETATEWFKRHTFGDAAIKTTLNARRLVVAVERMAERTGRGDLRVLAHDIEYGIETIEDVARKG